MPVTHEQEEKLSHMLTEIEMNMAALNDWEKGFASDHIKRYEEWGAKISLSPKQWGALEKIYEKATRK